MTLNIEPITVLWFLTNATALVLTLVALSSAIRDLRYAQWDTSPSHEAREVIARGNVRREVLRAVQLSLLLSLVVFAVLSNRPVAVTLPIIILMLVPIVLLTSTAMDFRDRRRLARMLFDLIRVEESQYAREASGQENMELTKEVVKLLAGKEDKPAP